MKLLSKIRGGFKKKPFFYIICLVAIFIAISVIFVVDTLLTYYPKLATKEQIVTLKNQGNEFFDSEGKLFYSSDVRRVELTKSADLPETLLQATVAVEDQKFYTHSGIDFLAILRAFKNNLTSLSLTRSGGSTLTQQLVKNSVLSPERTFTRKFQESILALVLEAKYTKAEILAMYLSSVYYGDGSYGATQAAQNYFGKTVSELNLSEAATLAGLTRAPSYYSPREDLQRSADRRNLVLKKMLEKGDIDENVYEVVVKENLQLAPSKENYYAIHFATWLENEIKSMDNFKDEKNLKIYTTLNSSAQKIAEEKVTQNIEKFKEFGGNNAALIALDNSSGKVTAFVGSANWQNDSVSGKYNAVFGLRQAGSAFKPIVYLAALENGFTLSTVLHDQPTTFEKGYIPGNFDSKFRGDILPRFTLGNSINVPTVELANKVGLDKVLTTAQKLGLMSLKGKQDFYGSNLALGGGDVNLFELTNAYATLARNGKFKKVFAINKIIKGSGEEIGFQIGDSTQVASQENAFLITSILSDNTARLDVFGDRSLLNLGFPTAAKTGTTDSFKDSWTIGYTPEITVGVWVGDSKGKPMENITGVSGAAAIWNNFMNSFFTQKKDFLKPDGVVSVNICKSNGKKAVSPSDLSYDEYFVKGTEPLETGVCQ